MENGVLFQYFEWNLPNDGQLWKQLKEDASHLAAIGVTAVWIPPAYKADEQQDEGYATYDLFDFGEFDQKGTVRTKYGTRQELQDAIAALHENGIQVILDAVLNHKAGGDRREKFKAVEVDPADRNKVIGRPRMIEAYTAFDFPGRGDNYSSFKWHWYHFSGVDNDQKSGRDGIFRILGEGKGWSKGVDTENGNYDYLLANDIDVDNPEVADELKAWGRWAVGEFGFDGFRMDAVKHIDRNFMLGFLDSMRKSSGDGFYIVSEYWSQDIGVMAEYLAAIENKTDLFDIPLHFNLHEASMAEGDYDMRKIFDGTVVGLDSRYAVTFVDNHDSQSGSSLESTVEDWFKPLAYALILLMKEGYPTVFYGDYYSIGRKGSVHRKIIDELLDVRKRYAYGDQDLLFDDPNIVGLIRHGDSLHENSGLVLLMSNDADGSKTIVLPGHGGEIWYDITRSVVDEVTIDKNGAGEFHVKGRNIAVWVRK